ncbi:MAG: L-aspartate oxidase [Ferrimicrobium sp.]
MPSTSYPIATVAPIVDVCIVGGGIAAATTALSLSPATRLAIIANSEPNQTSSAWAQGGIAVATRDDDSRWLHVQDTYRAGGWLNRPDATEALVANGEQVLGFLRNYGVDFDPEPTKEGGHSTRRVWHAGGDSSGRAVVTALYHALQAMHRTPTRGHLVDLVRDDTRVLGVIFFSGEQLIYQPSRTVVLASGGGAALWSRSTNPPGNTGDAIASALRAGVTVSDLEFTQFHPTAMAVSTRPLPLITEALRGEGAYLVNDTEERFLTALDPRGELGPRDIVAQAVSRELELGPVFLDARHLGARLLSQQFPLFLANCHAHGFDPILERIPIAPAAHYFIGGVRTDAHAQTSLLGLLAVGECANSGVHGANRLASNSLLEGVAFGLRAADTISNTLDDTTPASQLAPRSWAIDSSPYTLKTIQTIMDDYAGIVRSGSSLQEGLDRLDARAVHSSSHLLPIKAQIATSAALVAQHILAAALARSGSIGTHLRTDAVDEDPFYELCFTEEGRLTPIVRDRIPLKSLSA